MTARTARRDGDFPAAAAPGTGLGPSRDEAVPLNDQNPETEHHQAAIAVAAASPFRSGSRVRVQAPSKAIGPIAGR